MSPEGALALVVPAGLLALLGWLVPRLLSLVWPEGVRPLIGLALASAALMVGASALVFLGLYLWQGVPIALLASAGWGAFAWHFLRLGALSTLFWGPILILSVAGLPRTWTRAVW